MKREMPARQNARPIDPIAARADSAKARAFHPVAWAALAALAMMLAACGNKGPLVKPNATSQPSGTTAPAPDAPVKPAATDGS